MPYGDGIIDAKGGRKTPDVLVQPRSPGSVAGWARTIVSALVGVVVGVFIGRCQVAEVASEVASSDLLPSAAPPPERAAVPSPVDPTPGAAAPSEAALSASFEFHRKVPASGDGFYVLGVVANDSAVPIGRPELVLVFLDAAGKEVGTDHGFAVDEVVEPGARSYLSTIVTDPPAYEEIRYEVVARQVGFRTRAVSGLRVEAGETRHEGSILRFWGQVHNEGKEPAKFVEVTVVAFDADEKLLGIHSGYAKEEVLGANESARFEVSAVIPIPARVEYLVTGMAP
jgi:hypothetical protein